MRRIYPQRIVGHWDKPLPGVRLPALAFYDAVEAAIAARRIDGIVMARVAWPEGGLFSVRRIYVQIVFDDILFFVSCIPVGGATYVSWWCGLSERGVVAWLGGFRHFGWMVRLAFRPLTFYGVDRIRAFEHALHASVLEAVDTMIEAKGHRRLSDAERLPVLLDFDRLP